MLLGCLVQLPLIYSACTAHFAGQEENSLQSAGPACLLQSTFSATDLDSEEAESIQPRITREAVLFEADSMEADSFRAETMESLRQRSVARSTKCRAHLSLLRRKTFGLEESRNASDKKLDELVDKFISQQSGSQDACASQLMETKHQLNQIHKYVEDLSVTVNATERAILALDKEQQDKLKQLKEAEQWKKEQLEVCQQKRDEAAEMYGKLSDEMKEMTEIASPGVSMNVATGTIATAEEASLLGSRDHQSLAFIDERNHHHHPQKKTQHEPEDDIQMLQSFIENTRLAAKQYESCITKVPEGEILSSIQPLHEFGNSDGPEKAEVLVKGKARTRHAASLSSSLTSERSTSKMSKTQRQDPTTGSKVPKFASEEKCAKEKAKLEKVYVKTYVELSRLKAEYSDMANSTACDDAVMSQFAAIKTPLQEDIDYLIKAIDKKVKTLQELRPRLETAMKAEKKLRKQIATLSEECAALPETESDLGKVREAIQALSACPGLSRVQFAIPKWTQVFVSFEQNAAQQSDQEQDKLMDEACDKETAGSRAAEVGEIEELTVEGIPTTNDADTPLIGACPNCDGDEGVSFISGHARVCWNPGKTLGHAEKNTDCSKGPKAILCVIDRPNLRQIPGES